MGFQREIRRGLNDAILSFTCARPLGWFPLAVSGKTGILQVEGRKKPMTYIVLNEEQSQVIARALETVEVRDPKGQVLARIEPPFTPEDVAEAKRRLASDQPRFSSQQVKAHLQALEEAATRDGLDESQLRSLLERLQNEARG
jgi:hypothetical protein